MSKRKLTPEQFQQLRELAVAWGKIVAQRAADNDPDACLELDFEQMEQLAAAAAQGLTEGTLAALLEQQTRTLNTEIPCPDCNTLCELKQKKRTLTIPKGQLQLPEPFCHCPKCRRDFFPPADTTATR